MNPLRDPEGFGFERCGRNVRIYDLVRITSPERIIIGDEVMIDDFVFLQGQERLTIGSYVHISMFSSITGGGVATIGDFVSIAPGVRILSGTDVPDGSGLMNPTIPSEHRAVVRSFVELGPFSYVGANSVVQPGVRIGEGAAVGSNSLVREDLDPWTINAGVPCRVIRERPSDEVLRRAEILRRAPGALD
jgi:acetyltransferase-like isoleucine patch superfamily enzyme